MGVFKAGKLQEFIPTPMIDYSDQVVTEKLEEAVVISDDHLTQKYQCFAVNKKLITGPVSCFYFISKYSLSTIELVH